MQLKILLPTQVLLDIPILKLSAESKYGQFTLLPHHVDYVSALEPGLLSFQNMDGQDEYLAIDEGILVKNGSQVLVSTRNAISGEDLGGLQTAVQKQFRQRDERELKARSALVRLEAGFIRRFTEIGDVES